MYRNPASLGCFFAACSCAVAAGEPLCLAPENPHYFRFRGRPTVVITSGEHYGAVLNLDFNMLRYLDTLAAAGLNGTRLFSGAYVEPQGAFGIAKNTLAPAPGRFICPWARSRTPGYAGGGAKFDLSRWDPGYFQRLRTFVREASRRGIIVEINLFCPFYSNAQWRLSPMNPANNINSLGKVGRAQVYTLDKHGGLLPVQEAMVRKFAEELREFDNIYYEIMNEPYIRRIPRSWQWHMADVLASAEKSLGVRHLISMNIANGKARVRAPHPAVSILNFHYAFPPEAVALNYGLGRVIGENETGFHGTAPEYYRIEAWAFILAGGGLFNNLDYSFTVGHEDGRFAIPKSQPGSGGPLLRRQLGILSRFIHRFDFVRMVPARGVFAGPLPAGIRGEALAQPGRQYAVYLYRASAKAAPGRCTLRLDLPAGAYRVRWIRPESGEESEAPALRAGAGGVDLETPVFARDLALRLVRE